MKPVCRILASICAAFVFAQLWATAQISPSLIDTSGLPESFDLDDFKFRPDQIDAIRTFLRQDAAARGEKFDESLDVIAGLKHACEAGPNTLIALLASSDKSILELALEGLAIQFGPAANTAVPKILRVAEDPSQDERIAQLAVHSLGRIGLEDPSLPALLKRSLERASPTRIGLRGAIVEVLGKLGPAAQPALPLLQEELGSPSARVQYKTLLAISSVSPAEVPPLDPLIERGSLESLSPAALVSVAHALKPGTVGGDKLLRMFIVAGGETAPKYLRCLAVSVVGQAHPREISGVEMFLDAIGSDDDFLSALGAQALSGIDATFFEAIPPLTSALSNPNARVRTSAAITLKRFGAKAAAATEALAEAVRGCTAQSSEAELEAYLITLKTIGPAASAATGALLSLLPEQAPIFQNRQKFFLHHIRGFVLITLADIGVPKSALPFILDSLANSDQTMSYSFAAAARAAGSLGKEAKVSVPYLLRPLRGELRDDFLSFESLRGHRSSTGDYTTCLVEAIRALSRIGSEARDAIPLLEELLKKPFIPLTNPERLQRVPDVSDEARKALKAIRG